MRVKIAIDNHSGTRVFVRNLSTHSPVVEITDLCNILALGAIIADELYHRTVPVVVLPEASFHSIKGGDYLTIAPDGTVNITPTHK